MKTTTTKTSFGHFEQRVANQERRIRQGLAAGTLTQAEAAPLQQRLDAAKAQLKDGFDGPARCGFKKLFGDLSNDIHAAKHNDVVDAQQRTTNLDQRIAAGVKDTEQEAAALKEQATSLKGELAAATTPEAKKAVEAKLAAFSKTVHAERHDGELDAGKRMENFAQRIAAGVKDGSLTQREATRLSERFAGVEALTRNGAVSPELINRLDRSIFHARHDAQVSGDKAQKALGGLIDSLTTSGKLTADEATKFKASLAQLGEGTRARGPQLNVLREDILAAAASPVAA